MNMNKEIRVRASAQDHALYERYAADRGMTVSDLVRVSVEAFCSGTVGISFAPACAFRDRHTPGFTCPGCGGSARAAA
jgi:hypothetical protein